MSIGAKCGSFALVLGLLVGAAPALAEDKPPSTWSEPPVRGSTGPQAPEAAKPDDAKPAAEAPAKPAADAPAKSESAASTETSPAPAAKTESRPAIRPVRASAKLRRQHIRREAARPRAVAEAPPRRRPQRHVLAARPVPSVVRRSEADRAYAARPYQGMVRRHEQPAFDDGETQAPYRARQAGWGNLLGDNRARRIAEAREAGFLVMRSRTVEYPDGTVLRRLRPYEPGPFD